MKCKSVDVPLMKKTKTRYAQYYMCRPCASLIKSQWYHAGNQTKQQQYNRTYQIKQLTKK